MDTSTLSFASATKSIKIPGKLQWPGGPSIQQYFPLPSTLMHYLITSFPKVYLKLSQTCKYIFEKHQILVVANMDETKICSETWEECLLNGKECCSRVDVFKLSSKIWLTDYLYLIKDSNILSLLRPKLYRCSNIGLVLSQNHVLLEDLKFMASSAEIVSLVNVKIFHKDGSLVMLNEILKVLPKIEEFLYEDNPGFLAINDSVMKNILELQNLDNLTSFSSCLSNTPEVIKINDLFRFIQKCNHTEIIFTGYISARFKLQLNKLIDMIIESECRNCLITYYGQDAQKKNIMLERRRCINN